jgi:hypothetical protein
VTEGPKGSKLNFDKNIHEIALEREFSMDRQNLLRKQKASSVKQLPTPK